MTTAALSQSDSKPSLQVQRGHVRVSGDQPHHGEPGAVGRLRQSSPGPAAGQTMKPETVIINFSIANKDFNFSYLFAFAVTVV